MFFGRNKQKYPYYRHEKSAFLSKEVCDICGKKRECCDGQSFERGVHCVCRRCFDKGLATAYVPPEIALQVIGPDANEKINNLRHTPPVFWLRNNEWPCCCNDFKIYEGLWRLYTIRQPDLEDTFEDFQRVAGEDPRHPIENIRQVYEDLPYIYMDYVFTCPVCGKRTIIVQEDTDQELVKAYRENPELFRGK